MAGRTAVAILLAAGVLGLGPVLPAVRSAPVPAAPEPTTAAGLKPGEDSYHFPETRRIVRLVDAAATAIQTRGEAAFVEFRRPGSRWFEGDIYVFVWDLDGLRLVYPPDPKGEQTNQAGLTDAGGKPIGRQFLEAARSPAGQGWVHYQWPRPGTKKLEWKSAYIRRARSPEGRAVLVGSGNYQPRIEPAFIVAELEAAAALIARQGENAFSRIRDPKSRFFFHDTYVFALTPAGVEVLNPAFPALEGKNVLAMKDASGKPFVREFIDLAMTRGSGWVRYLWPRPEDPTRPVPKRTYVKRVTTPEGDPLVLGAGLYPGR
jgi:signal transduction histidine kinase